MRNNDCRHFSARLLGGGKPLLVPAMLLGALLLSAQDSKPEPSSTAPVAPPPGSTSLLPPVPFDSNATLHHLNQAISWYRHATSGVQSVGLPSDTIYQDNARNLGGQVVRLAFQSAKAEAGLIKAQQKAGENNQPARETTQMQALAQMRAKTSAQVDQLQAQIEKLTGGIPKARASERAGLSSRREALESELDLQKALLEAVNKMATFVEANGEGASGLEGEINQLARSIPEVLGTTSGQEKPVTAAAPAKPGLANSGGLISQLVTLYDYMTAVHRIGGLMDETRRLKDVVDQLRAPMRAALRSTIQESQNLSNQPPDTDPAQLQTEREKFQQITLRFKQLSAVLMPLSQELIVLGDSNTNFDEWRNSITRESKFVLRSVLIRVGGILAARWRSFCCFRKLGGA